MFWWSVAAHAFPVAVTLPVPDSIALPVKAEVLTVKGKAVGDDCPGAVADAFAQAPLGAIVLQALVDKDADGSLSTDCKQRVAGPNISASRVKFDIVVLLPGQPEEVYPKLDPDRALQIVKLLAVLGEGSPENVPIDDIEGSAWVRLPRGTVPKVLHPAQFDLNARATRAYRVGVTDRAATLAPLLGALPEVDGAVIEVDVVSEDPAVRRSQQTEVFRFIVPTPAFRRYAIGKLNAQTFLSEMRIEHAPDTKKRKFERIDIDLIGGELVVEDEPAAEIQPARELPEDDLSGVEDK